MVYRRQLLHLCVVAQFACAHGVQAATFAPVVLLCSLYPLPTHLALRDSSTKANLLAELNVPEQTRDLGIESHVCMGRRNIQKRSMHESVRGYYPYTAQSPRGRSVG